jgi:histidyl-tRNA synthetase
MKTVKGFEDYTGKEAEKREKIVEILKKNFRLYSFEPAETPIIEKEKFVKKDSEDEAVSDVYLLKDKGDRKLALRYEFTFQLERIAKNKKLPYKRYQIGPVFRDEPTKKNRFRQFTQCDVDIVGSSKKEEAEILKLTKRILDDLKIEFKIFINNRKLLNEILDKEKVKKKEKVIRIIDKLDKKKEEEVRKELEEYNAENILEIFKNNEKFFKKYDSYKEIRRLKDYCKKFDVEVTFLPSLARGLSYYNGTIFEVKGKLKETIVGGGSFEINKNQATGISFGLERLSELSKINLNKKKVLVLSINQEEKAIELAEKLRDNSINSEIYYNKVSKGLEYANSKNIDNVIFVGDKELPKLKLKDMKTGVEEILKEKYLIDKIKPAYY